MFYPASNLGQLRTLVQATTGRKDAEFLNVIDNAINWSQNLAAAIFKPSELDAWAFPILLTGEFAIDLQPTGMKIMYIKGVRNEDDQTPFYIMNHERMMYLLGSCFTTVGKPKYIAQKNRYLYFNCTTNTDIQVRLYYLQFPTKLVDTTDTLMFGGYDDFIVSTASKFAFSAMEEVDTAKMWETVITAVSQVHQLTLEEKNVIERYINPGLASVMEANK